MDGENKEVRIWRRLTPPILTALKKLGYRKIEVRNDTLHARRGADHLIIKLARKGTVKRVSAHRDTPSRPLPFANHRAVKGKIGSKLAKEFKTLYLKLRRRSSSRKEE